MTTIRFSIKAPGMLAIFVIISSVPSIAFMNWAQPHAYPREILSVILQILIIYPRWTLSTQYVAAHLWNPTTITIAPTA
jgi:hypothetical protein